jgi:hypothetical protein
MVWLIHCESKDRAMLDEKAETDALPPSTITTVGVHGEAGGAWNVIVSSHRSSLHSHKGAVGYPQPPTKT